MSIFKFKRVGYGLAHEIFGQRPDGMSTKFYVQCLCGHEVDENGKRFIPLALTDREKAEGDRQ